jgi:hypothetical protein
LVITVAPPIAVRERLAFPGVELVSAAAAMFERRPAWTQLKCGNVAYDLRGPEGREFRIVISAGTVGVRMSDPARSERNGSDGFGNVKGLPRGRVLDFDGHDGSREYGAFAPAPTGELHPVKASRQVEGWSRRSRARMTQRLAQLDWSPMYAGGRSAVMTTLTYPGDWLTVAPDGATVKRHLRAFWKRYARRWGAPFVGVWKLEFQRRGAPHLHLLHVPPADPTFREWLSATWAAVVAHPDPHERRRHELAGTGVDYLKGGRCFDPKRAAVYFSKHGGAAGGKEYQHTVPVEWQEEGKGPGRFWGYVGLDRVVAEVVVQVGDYVQLRRTIRRWSRAQDLVRTVRRVDWETGQVGRRVTRRHSHLGHGGMQGGTVLLNDGPAFAVHLARFLSPPSRSALRRRRVLP